MVGVALDTMKKQIESQLQQRNYEGFLLIGHHTSPDALPIAKVPGRTADHDGYARAGKGTQAKYVAEHFGIRDLDRRHLPGQRLGDGAQVEAARYMDAGDYVPDEVTNLMVRPDRRGGRRARLPARRLPAHAGAGRRARRHDRHTGHALDAVVVLAVDPDEIVQRLLQRGRGRGPGRRHRGRHPRAGALHRADRAAGVEVYRSRGILIEVDGMGEVEDVTRRIFEALDEIPQS